MATKTNPDDPEIDPTDPNAATPTYDTRINTDPGGGSSTTPDATGTGAGSMSSVPFPTPPSAPSTGNLASSTGYTAQTSSQPADDPTGASSVPPGYGTVSPPWDPNTNSPQSDFFPGWHWDPNMARYMKNPATAIDTSTTGTPAPPAAPATPPVAPPATPSGGTPAAPAAPSPTGAAPYAPQATPPTVGPSAGTTAANSAFSDSIRAALLKALGQGPVSADDPDIAPAITANRVATERGLADQRDQIAERLNAQGLAGSGSLDQQMQAARERATTGEAQFSGNAVLDQAKARRQELTTLLQTGAGVMSGDDQRALQGKIADLDAFLREQGITNQSGQFYDQLGMTAAQFEALLNEQSVRDALGL